MKLLICCWLGIFCPGVFLCAQNYTSEKQFSPLAIGDTVPADLKLNNLINYPVSEFQLSALRGKAVLLDFWASWCSACIKALPKLQQIQEHFDGKLEVQVVAYEPTPTVKNFLSKNEIGKQTSLPFITRDTIFKKLFPHRFIPHIVWIDAKGIVRAITDAEYVTVQNVAALVKGESIALPEKKDVLNYSGKYPLLENKNGGEEGLLIYRSLFTAYIDGLFSGRDIYVNRDSTTRRITYMNASLLSLYYAAAIRDLPSSNRIVLEVENRYRYIDTTSGLIDWKNWAKDNIYCYELTVPYETSERRIRELMLADLNKTFNLNGRIETRAVQVMAIVQKGEKSRTVLSEAESMKAKRITIPELVRTLNNYIIGKPLIPVILDESNYHEPIEVDLDFDQRIPIADLRKQLLRNGFDLIEVERILPVFVLTENSFNDKKIKQP
jgi:thiol-disulfide isomerase/thioredoxin